MNDSDDEFDPIADEAAREQAMRDAAQSQPRTMKHEDFVYVAAEDLFRNVHTMLPYPAKGVDARVVPWRVETRPGRGNNPPQEVAVPPSQDIRRDPAKTVDAVTWYPLEDKIIEGMSITATGDIRNVPDNRLLNLYVPPQKLKGTVAGAAPWLDLGKRLIPDDKIRHRIHQILAFKLLYPHIKVNCGILIAGNRRVGKDMWIDAFFKALGPGNTQTIDPDEIFAPFNPYVQCVGLKINEMEAQNAEHRAWALIKKLKPLCAAPPLALFVNDKNVKRYGIPNVCLVVAMTNALKSIYMEEDRGRWLVVDAYHLASLWFRESDPEYFIRYKQWMDDGGEAHVAAYLETVDLSDFNPGDPVIATDALEALIAMSNEAPDDALESALEHYEYADAIAGPEILDYFTEGGNDKQAQEIRDLFKSRAFVFRVEKSGYRIVHKTKTDAERNDKEKPRFTAKMPGIASAFKASFVLVHNRVSHADEQAAASERVKTWAARRAGRVTTAGGDGPIEKTGTTVVPIRPDKF